MSYRCVAAAQAGFIQQLAVGCVANGYYYYVTGVIPSNKPPAKTDCKILAAYDIDVSKWTRARRKRAGQANVQYLRYGRFYVIIATHGVQPFFSAEAKRLGGSLNYQRKFLESLVRSGRRKKVSSPHPGPLPI